MSRMEFQHAFDAVAATPGFDRAPLWRAYPEAAHLLSHRLDIEPCFDWSRLADTIAAADRALIEIREDTPQQRFRVLPEHPADLRALVHGLAGTKRWIMLRELDRWPDFAPLVADILQAVAPVVETRTGAIVKPTAFLFISSPGLVTPLHFDPEYNILFQISGRKRFTILPPSCGLPSRSDNERFHRSGDNLLDWRPELAAQGWPFDLAPGDALHVPFKAPHTVTVGTEPSISLSVTWRSHSSLMQDDAWALNGLLGRYRVRLPAMTQSSTSYTTPLRVIAESGIGASNS